MQQVDDADIVKGLVRHNKFTQIDESQFKLETQRCFDVLGFTDKKFLPETYIKGEQKPLLITL